MISDNQLDWLKLALVPGLGPAQIQKLLTKFDGPGEVLSAPSSQLIDSGIKTSCSKAIQNPVQERLNNAISWLESSPTHHLLTIDDAAYPSLLKQIADPPAVLFIIGDPAIVSQLQLAVVGSRNPTSQGRENAYQFAHFLAQTGLVITSGLALGIDGASHEGALDADGKTVAVIGNGPDRVYPARHQQLAHRIASNGAIVSEFPPGTKPLPGHFPRRNRLISGLSLGTLVIEAAKKSGSLITAYRALEQAREVFAIPGSIHNPLARGCHQLIRQGGKLVETAEDIIEELGPLAQASIKLEEQHTSPRPEADKNHAHQDILDSMGYDPVSVDSLAQRTGMKINQLSSVLLILEMEGKITPQAGGHYIRNGQT